MNLLYDLKHSIKNNFSNNAFSINNVFYTYEEFAQVISNTRNAIQKFTKEREKNVGLITNDDIFTYASIIALWMEGKAYVPLNTDFPMERNKSIMLQAKISTILGSTDSNLFKNSNFIKTNSLIDSEMNLQPKNVDGNEFCYILFTSGTTGVPKGVPISFNNLKGFIDAFWNLNYTITNNDRCLQMFELTFDMSVVSYLAPILKGACVYTIPKEEIKFSYIFELLENHQLTFVSMVPSIIHYLRPYFDEIYCPDLRFCLFAGEALTLDVTEEWSKCIPNATIYNAYGPTECTILATDYEYKRNVSNKVHNGILSIGKNMSNTISIIIDENNNEVEIGEKGELCLSGILLTAGYWQNEEKNKEAFFHKMYKGKLTRFYRTGDLCSHDKDGDILFHGRIDFQAKIQGFRVELSEIEFHAKSTLNKINAVALAFTNNINNTEVGLVIESEPINTKQLLEYLNVKLPKYMIPTQIKFIENFPLNSNGKTDRNKLTNLFTNKI